MVLMEAVSRPAETLDDAAGPALAAPALPRRNHVGTISLVCAIAGMVACRVGLAASDAPWLRLLGAGFEAATVGGLADWFAVTALFRHPLGLPIPHTAIIRERKDQFGATLGAFVQDNFLTAAVVVERIRSGRLVERATDWLAEPANAATIARQGADLVA